MVKKTRLSSVGDPHLYTSISVDITIPIPTTITEDPRMEREDEGRYSGWPLLVARERRRNKIKAEKTQDPPSACGRYT